MVDYWKYRAKMLELQLEEYQLQYALSDVNNRKTELLKACGLKPGMKYRFDDEKEELVETANG